MWWGLTRVSASRLLKKTVSAVEQLAGTGLWLPVRQRELSALLTNGGVASTIPWCAEFFTVTYGVRVSIRQSQKARKKKSRHVPKMKDMASLEPNLQSSIPSCLVYLLEAICWIS